MATKSFDELIAGANTIKDNQLPESNTSSLVGDQLVQMSTKLKEENASRMLMTNEYNVSVLRPTGGVKADGTAGGPYYTLETATAILPEIIAQLGGQIQKGNLLSFLAIITNVDSHSVEKYEYLGGNITVDNFISADIAKYFKNLDAITNTTLRTFFLKVVAQIFIIPNTDYKIQNKIALSYLTVNHSAIKGENYFGIQFGIIGEDGTLSGQSNFFVSKDDLQKGKLVQLSNYGNETVNNNYKIYIRPSESYEWISDSLIETFRIFINESAYNRCVEGFLLNINEKIKNNTENLNFLDTNLTKYIGNTNSLSSELQTKFISTCSEIYIKRLSPSETKPIYITYLTFNHSAICGVHNLGLQLSYLDNNAFTKSGNFYINADNLQKGQLSKLNVYDSSTTIVSEIEVYIRPSKDFAWNDSDVICVGTNLPIFELSFAMVSEMWNFDNVIDSRYEKSNNVKTLFINGNSYLNPSTYIDYNSLNEIIKIGKNKFDSKNIAQGWYFSGDSGGVGQVSNYVAAYNFVPIEPSTSYSCNKGNVHICFYDKDRNFIKGYAGEKLFDSPSNAKYIRISCEDVNINSLIVYKTSEGDTYVPFAVTFKSAEPKNKEYLVVDKNGNGDYTTLTAATDAASDGATILVMPGIYDNEVVVAGKTKTLFIVGIDREKCVIKNNFGNYANAVIHIASGCLRNLTVIQEGTTPPSGAYAVHADFHPMYNSTLDIENCTLQSNVPSTGGIGIGMRGGCRLTIKNSRLISGSGGRALYAHDNNNPGYDGQQILSVLNCIIESPDQAIIIQGQGKTDERTFAESQYYLEFIGNRIKGTCAFVNWYSDVSITDADFQGVMNLRLSELSWGNSEPVFNN